MIEYSQGGIGGQHIRETHILEGTRQKSLGNAFRGWNPDCFGRDEGQKREIAAARARLIVQNRTLGSWIHGDGQENEYSGVMVQGRHLQYAGPRGSKFYLSSVGRGSGMAPSKAKGSRRGE